MTLQRAVGLVIFLAAAGAWAQDARPTLTPFPLDLTRAPELSEKDTAELQFSWRRLLRVHVLSPDAAAVDAALRETGRRDCEREDACLAALALKAGTLYAAFGAVALDVTRTQVVATGRVVRDDGKAMGELRSVQVAVGAGFLPAAKDALARLVEALGVAGLSPVRPVDAPRLTGEPTRVGPAPAPAVERAPAGMPGKRVASFVALGAGVVGLGVGIGLLAGAEADAVKFIDAQGRVTAPPGPETEQRLAALGGQRAAGGVVLGVGVAAAATGALLFVMSAMDSKVAVGVAPASGGGVVSLAGVW